MGGSRGSGDTPTSPLGQPRTASSEGDAGRGDAASGLLVQCRLAGTAARPGTHDVAAVRPCFPLTRGCCDAHSQRPTSSLPLGRSWWRAGGPTLACAPSPPQTNRKHFRALCPHRNGTVHPGAPAPLSALASWEPQHPGQWGGQRPGPRARRAQAAQSCSRRLCGPPSPRTARPSIRTVFARAQPQQVRVASVSL